MNPNAFSSVRFPHSMEERETPLFVSFFFMWLLLRKGIWTLITDFNNNTFLVVSFVKHTVQTCEEHLDETLYEHGPG